MKKHRSFPDLLVLDLHWPRDGTKSDINSAREKVRDAIEEHKRQVSKLRSVVFEHLEPSAIGELVRIRKYYQFNELPILVYTCAGTITLDDPDVEVIYGNGADFLPKYRPAHVERHRVKTAAVEKATAGHQLAAGACNWRSYCISCSEHHVCPSYKTISFAASPANHSSIWFYRPR